MTNGPSLESSPLLRRATADDVLLYFELANDFDVRSNSFAQRPISLKEHEAWFGLKLGSADVLMLVIELDGKPVGQIRFDVGGDVAMIGFALAARARGRGLGAYLLREGVERLRLVYPRVRIARGLVRPENLASRRAFETTGFRLAGPTAESDIAVVYDFEIEKQNVVMEPD